MAAHDDDVEMRLDYVPEPGWARVSNRAWNGSSRSGGGRKARGSVSLPDPGRVRVKLIPLCSCGRSKVACPSCRELWCDAPGHQRHVCGGSR